MNDDQLQTAVDFYGLDSLNRGDTSWRFKSRKRIYPYFSPSGFDENKNALMKMNSLYFDSFSLNLQKKHKDFIIFCQSVEIKKYDLFEIADYGIDVCSDVVDRLYKIYTENEHHSYIKRDK